MVTNDKQAIGGQGEVTFYNTENPTKPFFLPLQATNPSH